MRRVVKILVPFAIAYLYVRLVLRVILHAPDAVGGFLMLATLTIPTTSTWYIITQLLMYVFVFIACKILPGRKAGCVAVLTAIYCVACIVLQMPSYWWMTAPCFPMGMLVTESKLPEERLIVKPISSFVAVSGCAGLLFIASRKIPVLSVLFDLALCLWLLLLLKEWGMSSRALAFIGRQSIAIYLIHIGLVSTLLGANDLVIGVLLLLLLTGLGTALVQLLSKPILARLLPAPWAKTDAATVDGQ